MDKYFFFKLQIFETLQSVYCLVSTGCIIHSANSLKYQMLHCAKEVSEQNFGRGFAPAKYLHSCPQLRSDFDWGKQEMYKYASYSLALGC